LPSQHVINENSHDCHLDVIEPSTDTVFFLVLSLKP
jgi:hypothetical protein